MIANLKHAAGTGKGARIGGGDFTPAECAATADRLEQADRMETALQEIAALLQKHPDFKRGNDIVHFCAHRALGVLK